MAYQMPPTVIDFGDGLTVTEVIINNAKARLEEITSADGNIDLGKLGDSALDNLVRYLIKFGERSHINLEGTTWQEIYSSLDGSAEN